MNASNYIIEVNEPDFQYEVLAYSEKTPVVVDFWAAWCIPCRTLGPLLEKLAQEGQGAFRLAKVNVDANQKLAQRFNITSIPAVKAFKDGRVAAEFSGLQPEHKLRLFLRGLAPSESDLTLEKGSSLLALEDYRAAEAAFQQVLEKSPASAEAQLGLAKSLLAQGRVSEALPLLRGIPAGPAYVAAQALLPLAKAVQRLQDGPDWSENELEAAYLQALRLAVRGNLPAAMDGLLDVLRQDKRFRGGEARLVMLALLEILGELSEHTRPYRQELASVLF